MNFVMLMIIRASDLSLSVAFSDAAHDMLMLMNERTTNALNSFFLGSLRPKAGTG